MKLSRGELAEVLYGLVKDTADHRQVAQDIAQYLVAERRTNELDTLLREVERLRFEREGIVEALATTARPLSETVKQLIREAFGAKTRVVEREDKNLVGGVYVQTLDKRLDLSVRGQLSKLKNTNGIKV